VDSRDGFSRPPAALALRRTVLMVSVLDGLDLVLTDAAVTWPAAAAPRPLSVTLPWAEVQLAVAGCEPESAAARTALVGWLQMRRRLAGWAHPEQQARPVGLPIGHLLHPGPAWVRQRVLGGVLDVGLGVVGLGEDPDEVVVAPSGLLAAAGGDEDTWWQSCPRYLAEKAAVAAERFRRDPTGPLRPIGDCDVVTLLASSAFRAALCAADPMGLRTAAVPMRRRGWLDLGRIDPAFAVSAAAATEPEQRGFERPILITREEVSLALPHGDPTRLVLRDPVPSANAWERR